jgi:hypothetical protein
MDLGDRVIRAGASDAGGILCGALASGAVAADREGEAEA